jgi:mannosyltransferase
VVGVVLIGVILRFAAQSPLWLDEALTVNISKLPLSDIPGALRHDGLPPLYYFLLHGWMRVFGDGDTAVRALSGTFGLITLLLAWLVGRRVGGRPLAWIALVLFAASPYAVRYGTEARMYSLVMALVLSGWLLLLRVLDRGGWWAYVAIAVVSGCLLLTHYWSMWLLGAVGIVLGVLAWRAPDAGQRRRRLGALAAVAAGGLLFLPWLPIFVEQLQHTGTPWAGPVRPTSFVSVTLADFGTGAGRLRDGEVLGLWMAVLSLLGVFARGIDRHRLEVDLRTVPPVQAPAAVVVLTSALAVAASWVAGAAYQSRYAAGVFAILLMVAAVGASRFKGRRARALAVGGFALLGLALATYNSTTDRTQAAVIATAIDGRAAPGDLVVYCPDQLAPAVDRVLAEPLEGVTYPDFGSPRIVDWYDYDQRNDGADPARFAQEVVDRAPPDAAIWLVASSGYRTPGTACDVVRDELAKARSAETLVTENPGSFFESASLYRFSSQ